MDITKTDTKLLKVADLRPNEGQIPEVPSNPRFITESEYEKLCNSLREDNLTGVLQVKVYNYQGEWIVLDGNMRLKAMQEVGIKEAQCLVVPQDAPAAVLRKIVIEANSTFGRWDTDMLANEWDEVELDKVAAHSGIDLPEWGIDPKSLGLQDPTETKEADVKEDDFDPEQVRETKVQTGEIWLLGQHRLMCGDSTDPEQVRRLLGKETPDLIYTDPPYGMNAVSNSGVLKEKYKTDIHGDDDNSIAIKAFGLCQTLFPNARQVWWGANYYTECLPSSECWLVWDKNNGMSDQTDCELAWANFRSVVRQFTMVSEKQNRIHPTQKPCKLFADIVARMKKQETYNKVLDLFGGSGSTMIACEQMGIQSFIMEYDPHFCTEIIARWEKLTGQKATRL